MGFDVRKEKKGAFWVGGRKCSAMRKTGLGIISKQKKEIEKLLDSKL